MPEQVGEVKFPLHVEPDTLPVKLQPLGSVPLTWQEEDEGVVSVNVPSAVPLTKRLKTPRNGAVLHEVLPPVLLVGVAVTGPVKLLPGAHVTPLKGPLQPPPVVALKVYMPEQFGEVKFPLQVDPDTVPLNVQPLVVVPLTWQEEDVGVVSVAVPSAVPFTEKLKVPTNGDVLQELVVPPPPVPPLPV